MRCHHCEREIKKDEEFYEISEKLYCHNCIKEHEMEYYKIDNNGELVHIDEVVLSYNDKDDYILSLKVRLRIFKEDKEKYENKNNPTPGEESYLRYRIKKLEETKKVLEKLQNEKEKVNG